jgi:hypothetical protein
MGQYFEHLGFTIVGEWYTVGEFNGLEEESIKGKLGNIKGRPNEEDLLDIENRVREVLRDINLV